MLTAASSDPRVFASWFDVTVKTLFLFVRVWNLASKRKQKKYWRRQCRSYFDYGITAYDAVWFRRCLPTLWLNMLALFSW